MQPVFSPFAPSQIPLELIYRWHMDTTSCWTVPKHDGSGHRVFYRWLCVAVDKLGRDAFHQEPFPENMKE